MPRPKLTPTQEEVLLLIGDGLTTPEIAVARGTGPSAADHTVQLLKKRFGVKRKRELVRIAQRHFKPH